MVRKISIVQLHKLEADRKIINEKISICNRQANKSFIEEHKALFRTLDILIIIALICNIFALMITNALVVKKAPETKLYETNIIASETLNVEHIDTVTEKGTGNKMLLDLLIRGFSYSIILTLYYFSRKVVIKKADLFQHMAGSLFVFLMLFFDFASDLGYYLGKIIWG